MCRFAKGNCWFGTFCYYAHDKPQMRSGPRTEKLCCIILWCVEGRTLESPFPRPDDPKGMPGTEAFAFDLAAQSAFSIRIVGARFMSRLSMHVRTSSRLFTFFHESKCICSLASNSFFLSSLFLGANRLRDIAALCAGELEMCSCLAWIARYWIHSLNTVFSI